MKDVVLLHGFAETAEIWDSFVPNLEDGFQYHIFDYSKITFCHTIEDYADWLDTLIKEKNIENLIIIGHSMGGYIALAYARKFIEKVEGIGLIHSTASNDSPEKQKKRDKTIEFIRKNGVEEFIKDFLPQMYNPHYRKENREFIYKLLDDNKHLPAEALINATESMKNRQDQTDFLRSLTIPVLYVVGKEDQFMNYDENMSQIRTLRKPYVLIINHIAHAGMYEAPFPVITITNEFLNACISEF